MTETSPFESLYQEELYSLKPHVIVVLPEPWESVGETSRVLLGKILGSVKLSVAAVQIVTKKSFEMNDLEALNPAQVIAFGSGLKGNLALYELHSVRGIPVIVADDLQQLDDARKKSLWGALRQMFGL